MSPTWKTVGSTFRTANPQGQSNPPELAWLRTGMVDMRAMHESCALTDFQYRVGDMRAFGPSAHALFVTVGHFRPGKGVMGWLAGQRVAGGSRSSGGCRHRVENGRRWQPRAGARAGVTGPSPRWGAMADRAAAANTRATQVQVQEASNTNSERQAYRNPAKTCEAPAPGQAAGPISLAG